MITSHLSKSNLTYRLTSKNNSSYYGQGKKYYTLSNLTAINLTTTPNKSGEIMNTLPPCPLCHSTYTYKDGLQFICPECAHEWEESTEETTTDDVLIIKDSAGNRLQDGDTITVIKDLKVKNSSLVIKVGTKVKNIRLVDGDHDIDCKIEGIGPMQLKSQYVKKV